MTPQLSAEPFTFETAQEILGVARGVPPSPVPVLSDAGDPSLDAPRLFPCKQPGCPGHKRDYQVTTHRLWDEFFAPKAQRKARRAQRITRLTRRRANA